MRTALLAAYRTSLQGSLRAGMMLAGRPVLAWQVALVCAAGCERVIVLSDAPDEALAEAERECRAQGAAFHRLRAFAGLAALVHADDDLLLLGDGILPDRAAMLALIGAAGPGKPLTKGVLCLPDDDPQAIGWPDDFERIDAARCWAGLAVMRAAPVQRLGDFAPDSNATSLLLRMALQEGTPCRTLAPEERAPGQWVLAHSEAALAGHEQALIARHRKPAAWSAPGAALAEWLAARIALSGPVMAASGASLGGIIALLAAIGAAAAGWPLAAMAAGLTGSIALDCGAHLARIRGAVLGDQRSALMMRLHDPGRDVLAAAVLIAALGPGGGAALAALGPLTIGIARLAARSAPALAAAFWRDRSAQLAVMMIGAGTGWLAETAALLALAGIAQALRHAPQQTKPA